MGKNLDSSIWEEDQLIAGVDLFDDIEDMEEDEDAEYIRESLMDDDSASDVDDNYEEDYYVTNTNIRNYTY
jgi:hypothetical protein